MMKTPTLNFSRRLAMKTGLSVSRLCGFTLIEMMVAISIVAILASIAIPSFSDIMLTNKLRSYANDLVAGAHLARGEAIKSNAVVVLCASSNGTSCSGDWKNGWIVLSASNTVIQTWQAIDANYKIAPTATTVSFQPTGVGSTQVALTICRESPAAGSQERVVTISATGKPSVTKTTAGSC